MKTIKKTTLALTVTAAMAGSGLAQAADSPFAVKPLSQGYQVAAADPVTDTKAAEAKCGAAHAKTMDGKCGAAMSEKAVTDKAVATKVKTKVKTKAKPKAVEAKCGEGKCGGMK
jgi:uncharacterized low-complexity protein